MALTGLDLVELKDNVTKAKQHLNEACKILCLSPGDNEKMTDAVSLAADKTSDALYYVDMHVKKQMKFLAEEKSGI